VKKVNKMSSENLNKLLLSNFSGQGNTISIPKTYIKILNCYKKSTVLNQIIFWSNKSSVGKDGWFYKSYKEWDDEILIEERTLRRVFESLVEIGLCETKTKKVKGINTLWCKPNLGKVLELIEQMLSQPDRMSVSNRTKCPIGQPDKMSVSYIQKNTTEDHLHNYSKEIKKVTPSQFEDTYYSNQSPASSEQSLPALRITELSATQYNPYYIPENLLVEWAISRRKKKSPINKTSWNEINKQLSLCEDGGIKAIDAFTKMVAYGWPSLDAKKMIEFDKSSSEKKGGAVDMNSNDWGNEPSLF